MTMDANMRYLSKGKKYFAEVWTCGRGNKLYDFGVRPGDIIAFKMLSKGHTNPAILVLRDDGQTLQITNNEIFYDPWLVFTGCWDGTSFINNEDGTKARQGAYWVKKSLGGDMNVWKEARD